MIDQLKNMIDVLPESFKPPLRGNVVIKTLVPEKCRHELQDETFVVELQDAKRPKLYRSIQSRR